MIQFMKSRNDRYGEHESAEKLGIEVHTMGDGFTWDTKNPEQDIKTARETWALCVEKLRSGNYDIAALGKVDAGSVVQALADAKPDALTVILEADGFGDLYARAKIIMPTNLSEPASEAARTFFKLANQPEPPTRESRSSAAADSRAGRGCRRGRRYVQWDLAEPQCQLR